MLQAWLAQHSTAQHSKFRHFTKSIVQTLCLVLIVTTSAFSKSEIVLNLLSDSGEEVSMTSLDLKLFNLVIEDINNYNLQTSLNKTQFKTERSKDIKIDGEKYFYNRDKDDGIRVYDYKGNLLSSFKLLSVLQALVNADIQEEKCPACIVAAGILVSQGICSLSAGGEHAYCRSTCQCGVQSVSTTCVLGYRSTTCSCMPCPVSPRPLSIYPSGPGWNAPFFTGTPWFDSDGNIVFDLN